MHQNKIQIKTKLAKMYRRMLARMIEKRYAVIHSTQFCSGFFLFFIV